MAIDLRGSVGFVFAHRTTPSCFSSFGALECHCAFRRKIWLVGSCVAYPTLVEFASVTRPFRLSPGHCGRGADLVGAPCDPSARYCGRSGSRASSCALGCGMRNGRAGSNTPRILALARAIALDGTTPASRVGRPCGGWCLGGMLPG